MNEQTSPTRDRQGDCILTYSGRQFYPCDPRVEDVDIRDIAHSLAHQCRYFGHCREFYSIAQHSVLVSRECPTQPLFGLLHDAVEAYSREAYFWNIVRRWGESLPVFWQIREGIWRVIAAKFELPVLMPPEVKHADNVLLVTEMRDLMPASSEAWNVMAEYQPIANGITPWPPEKAEYFFLERAAEYLGRRNWV